MRGLLLLLALAAPALAAEPLLVFTAASVEPAMEEILEGWKAADGTTARGNYAASSQLARQIEQGAPADIMLSADERWMDELAAKQLIDPATRGDLLGNRLVLIAAAGQGFRVDLTAASGPGDAIPSRLAITDATVPLGRYAREAFIALGCEVTLEPRFLPAEDARAALRLVELGEAPAGVAYASDAVGDAKVAVVAEFPERLHAPIRYPVAALATARPGTAELLARLRSPEAAEIFRRRGFTVIAFPAK
jgi:molybdate transport system substrate-binding protein